MMGRLLEHGQNNLFTYRQQVPLMCRIVGSELMGMDGITVGASIAQNALSSLADEDAATANAAIYDFTLHCDMHRADVATLTAMLHDALAIMQARSREEAAMISNQMLRRLPTFIGTGRLQEVYPHLMCVGAALTSLLYDQPATRWMCLFVPLILCRAAVSLTRSCGTTRLGIVQVVARQVTMVLANQHRMLSHLRYIEGQLGAGPMRQAQ
jgi:hypothetical protein